MKTIVMLAALATIYAENLPVSLPDVGANLPARSVGVEDLLAITVYGAPELSRTARVGSDGLIRVPMLRQKIAVRGLMPAEIEAQLAEALEREQILVDPVVTVAIAEYGTRPVSVAGAGREPPTFDPHSRNKVVEALGRAEGLSPEAGRGILVPRPPPERK